jgi:hypothetical protein
MADTLTDGLNIDVEVDRNRVQLNGFVDSQAQIDRAGEIARSISVAASVQNNLQVSDRGSRATTASVAIAVCAVAPTAGAGWPTMTVGKHRTLMENHHA